jgi:hypothetical protein
VTGVPLDFIANAESAINLQKKDGGVTAPVIHHSTKGSGLYSLTNVTIEAIVAFDPFAMIDIFHLCEFIVP